MRKAIVAALLTPAILGAVAYKDTKRLKQSTIVLREMSHASDNGVPQELTRKAHCIVVVPGLKKIAFHRRRQVRTGLRILHHSQGDVEFSGCCSHRGRKLRLATWRQ